MEFLQNAESLRKLATLLQWLPIVLVLVGGLLQIAKVKVDNQIKVLDTLEQAQNNNLLQDKITSLQGEIVNKSKKLDNLLEQSLILKDFRVQTKYEFGLKESVSQNTNTNVMGLTTTAALINATEKGKILQLTSGSNSSVIYPKKGVMVVSLSFTPENGLGSDKLSFLEQFDSLALPYKSIIDSYGNQQIEFAKGVDITIYINGQVFEQIHEDLSFPFDTPAIVCQVSDGLFKDIEKRFAKLD